MTYFEYGEKEVKALKKNDMLLGDAINKIGHIYRETNPDIFSGVINAIVGQQISAKAHKTVYTRMLSDLKDISAETISAKSVNEIQKYGVTFKKAENIKSFASKVLSGEFRIDSLKKMSDSELTASLLTLDGVGVWTAEMLMLFTLERPDVLSFGDLGIHRGMQILYNREKIDKHFFMELRERYSPYCSVASLYLWEISTGLLIKQ